MAGQQLVCFPASLVGTTCNADVIGHGLLRTFRGRCAIHGFGHPQQRKTLHGPHIVNDCCCWLPRALQIFACSIFLVMYRTATNFDCRRCSDGSMVGPNPKAYHHVIFCDVNRLRFVNPPLSRPDFTDMCLTRRTVVHMYINSHAS